MEDVNNFLGVSPFCFVLDGGSEGLDERQDVVLVGRIGAGGSPVSWVGEGCLIVDEHQCRGEIQVQRHFVCMYVHTDKLYSPLVVGMVRYK